MTIKTLASGSSGNCSLLSTESGHLLIDAGISMRKIKNYLSICGLGLDDISGILVTHEHSDHISGLPMLIKHAKIPVYATRTVASSIRAGACVEGLVNELKAGEAFPICGVTVRAFNTPHDSSDSVGFRIEGSVSLGYCTDLGYLTDEVLEGLDSVDIAVIECNHDIDLLKRGPYPYHLKRRILSDRGHLSNRICAELSARLVSQGTADIILAHLSKENNIPALAEREVTSRLTAEGFTRDRDYRLYIAPAEGICQIAERK